MTKDSQGLLSDDELRQIIALVESLAKSSLDSLHLDAGRFRLTLGKGTAAAPAQAVASPAPQVRREEPRPISKSAAPRADEPAKKQTTSAAAAGLVEVRAPIMGLFYAKPDPAAPPFVSIGTEVKEGATVGLIEVMKIFNAVAATVTGVIAEVCVEDAATVEIGQPLFRIRPTKG